MFLYANGCSMTAGSEAENDEKINYKDSFPAVISNMLGWEHLNAALPGGSNSRIIRTTILWVENWLISEKDPAELFVLINWTGNDRLEVMHQNETYPLLVHDLDSEEYQKIPPMVRRYYESYLGAVDNRDMIALQNILLMESYLKSKNINYLFLNAIESWPTNLIQNRKLIYDALDKKHYLDGGRDRGHMREWLRSQGYPFAPKLHFRKDAYKAYAEMIVEYLYESGIISS